MSYTFLGHFRDLGEWLTPYGKQPWLLCRTRKPFRCAKSGKDFPEGTYAWRPARNLRNRYERIAATDTQTVARIMVKHPDQARLIEELTVAEKAMPLHRLSHYAGLDYRRAMRALESLEKQGLVHTVDEWGETSDWFQSDGKRHESAVIDWRRADAF